MDVEDALVSSYQDAYSIMVALPPALLALEYVTKEENWEAFLAYMKERAPNTLQALGREPTREDTLELIIRLVEADPSLLYIS